VQNNGIDLSAVPDASVTFVYCFDAMVHFYPEVVRKYIKEFRRVLAPKARGFVHYSNNHANPQADYRDHPGWRNYMSREIFEAWLVEDGLRPIKSAYVRGVMEVITEDDGNCDAITLFEAN
jgi:SAM-dependent methyltransferase